MKIKDKEVVRNKKTEKHTDHQLGKGRKGIKDKLANLSLSPSEITIYQPAVPKAQTHNELNRLLIDSMGTSSGASNRISTSSENDNTVNTSDESMFEFNAELIDITEKKSRHVNDGERAHSSGEDDRKRRWTTHETTTAAADVRQDEIIRDAEQAKARIFEVSRLLRK